jgi:hypothetical protein
LAALSDPSQLEETLKPHENIIDQIQLIVFLKNPIPFVICLVFVDLLFFIIYKLNIGFVPTIFLLLTVKALIELLVTTFAEPIKEIFVKEIQDRKSGTYHIYTLSELSPLLAGFASALDDVRRVLIPRGNSLGSAGVLLLVLGALFFLFLVTGTFWVNVIIVNLAFFLPLIVFHPQVIPHVLKTMQSNENTVPAEDKEKVE